MKDFTDFDTKVNEIETENFDELYQPLNSYFTVILKPDDSYALIWNHNSDCPTLIRNKVIEVAHKYLT